MNPRRVLYLVLAVALVASLLVAVRRERHEQAARTVEIAMDDSDFSDFARAYDDDEPTFLAELRRAGLTSLAVSEELGSGVATSTHAAAYSGAELLAQARISPVTDPTLAALVRAGQVRAGHTYLAAYDASTAARYARQLPLRFAPRAIRVLHRPLPTIWDIATQSDDFATEGLGLPRDRVALANRLGLRLVPRLQNDERFSAPDITALLRFSTRGARASTIVFFGLRNEVLGYPDQLVKTAAVLQARRLNDGVIETYDPKQEQLGDEQLARLVPDRIVRVEAIAKAEADKLTPDEIVERYLLGVNERNIRLVYLRPFAHAWKGRSMEATTIDIVRRIAAGIRASGKRIGAASPIQRFIVGPAYIVPASLAVPAIALLVLAALGIEGTWWTVGAFGGDLLLLAVGYASHHDFLARQLLALAAGLLFPAAGLLAIDWAIRGTAAPLRWDNAYLRGLLALVVATVVTLAGALTIVGLLSTPLSMTEIERFAGVKYILVLPALIGLGLYFFSDRFGARVDPKTAGNAPVRVLQLAIGIVLLGAAFVLVERSGNQSEIAPSGFELALRAHLTTLLQVRPRFKEFLVGYPALMMVPALVPIDRRRWAWLFVLGIGVGLGDIIDTFSHLHTPLRISLERVSNGAVIGIVVGVLAIAVYRLIRPLPAQ